MMMLLKRKRGRRNCGKEGKAYINEKRGTGRKGKGK